MNDEKHVIIDYLSVTFPLVISEDEDEQSRSQATYRVIRNFFKLENCECNSDDYAANHYKYQYKLSQHIILRCAGPISDSGYKTCQLELRGEGCREFERRRPDITWVDFFNFLYGLDPTFKRIDITIDDLSGMEISQEYLKNKILNGQYTSKFKSDPKFYEVLNQGQTIEFGSRKSPIQLCIYDKKREQENKGIQVDTEYWLRYEMRFRGAKADAVVLALCRDYQNSNEETYKLDLQSFATEELHAILQIKKDNKYKEKKNMDKADEDEKWLNFLDNAKKAELPKAIEKESTYETRRAYIMPKAIQILLLWYKMSNGDFELFFHDLLKEMYVLSGNMNNKQRKKFNQFLVENNLHEMTENEFDEMRMKLFEYAEEMELPF